MNGWLDSRTADALNWTSVALMAVCALLMAALGPFGQTERFLPSQRIGLWLLYCIAGLPVLALVLTGLRRRLQRRGLMWDIFRVALPAVLASPPILMIVEIIGLLEGRPLPHTGADWLGSAAEVAVLALPFAFLLDRFLPPPRALKPVPSRPETASSSPLDHFGDIYAVCAEGHYTRVFSEHGEKFHDRSFSSVLTVLADRDGSQVHRSWWVAREAVETLKPNGSSAMLTLRGGMKVPVARRRIMKLRSEGWPL